MARPKKVLLNECKDCGENIENLPQWIRRYNMCKACYYKHYPIVNRVKKSREKYNMTTMFVPREIYADVARYAKQLAKEKKLEWGNV